MAKSSPGQPDALIDVGPFRRRDGGDAQLHEDFVAHAVIETENAVAVSDLGRPVVGMLFGQRFERAADDLPAHEVGERSISNLRWPGSQWLLMHQYSPPCLKTNGSGAGWLKTGFW